ncbi:barstar family protein [Streptomyces mashuensis]|uniref:barstar family protein n=1 Tax=Streptomyces mashuensis TaxID=33904 RepID=UPI00167D3F3F|nr:barstar family protein [Streptomyces mashuensis]
MTGLLPPPGVPALLSGATPPGVYRLPPTDAPDDVAALATGADWHPARLRLAHVHDKAAFLDRCAADLDFPSWFGHNWDALADCLTDLSWWREAGKTRGHLLLAEDWETFRKSAPADARTAEAILTDAVGFWAGHDPVLAVLLA